MWGEERGESDLSGKSEGVRKTGQLFARSHLAKQRYFPRKGEMRCGERRGRSSAVGISCHGKVRLIDKVAPLFKALERDCVSSLWTFDQSKAMKRMIIPSN